MCVFTLSTSLSLLLFSALCRKNSQWGIDGNTGELADMRKISIMDSYSVKAQTLKTSVEAGEPMA